jgi:hypothetical protein
MGFIFSFLTRWYKTKNKKLFRKLNEAVTSIVEAGENLNLVEIMSQYQLMDLFFADLRYHDCNTDKMSLKRLRDAMI